MWRLPRQLTDALYSALEVLASSQGTMNNFTFGNGLVMDIIAAAMASSVACVSLNP
jgi:N-methylhydantoinase B/oxoprolinase/acetone carboxylase alpha subunit